MPRAKKVEHSPMFEQINEWYNSTPQKWNIKRVRNAVVKEWITAEEYKEITGEA